jgi:hypothetical protein
MVQGLAEPKGPGDGVVCPFFQLGSINAHDPQDPSLGSSKMAARHAPGRAAVGTYHYPPKTPVCKGIFAIAMAGRSLP